VQFRARSIDGIKTTRNKCGGTINMPPATSNDLSTLLFIVLIVAAGTWIVTLTHIALLIRSRAERNRQRKFDQCVDELTGESKKGELTQHKDDGVAADFSALIRAIEDQGRRNRTEERREDHGKAFREGLTILLLCGTLLAIGWQVAEMIKVYTPVEVQAIAANEQAKTAEDVEKRQLRAYVAANVITPLNDYSAGDKFYSATFVNEGVTPAYVLAYHLQAGVVTLDLPTTIVDDLRVPKSPHGIANGDYLLKTHTKTYTSGRLIVTPQNSAAIAKGTAAILFWGTITYRDVFGCWHYTSFCFDLRAQNGQPPGQYECPGHNDMDDANQCDKD
jgi:hypothetical protein